MTNPLELPRESEPSLDNEDLPPLTTNDFIQLAENEGKDNSFIASLTSFLNANIAQGRATVEQALQMLGLKTIEEAWKKLAEIHAAQIEAAKKNTEAARDFGSKVLDKLRSPRDSEK